MAYNLSTVRTRVQKKLDNTAFDASKINDFINDGQRDILGGALLPFMEREATAVTAVGSDGLTYTPAVTDVQKLTMLKVYSPTAKAGVIPYRDYEYIDANYPNPAASNNAYPQCWYLFNNTPKVYPNADDIYTIKAKYIKKPAELVNDLDVPELPEEYSELLVLSAYKRALEHEDNYDQAQVIQLNIDELRQNMIVRLGSRQNAGPYIIKQPRRPRWS